MPVDGTVTISKQFSFDAAHVLRSGPDDEVNWELFGRCSQLHGHTYTLTVYVTGEISPGTGMVLNYADLTAVVKPIIEMLDHKFLNDVFKHLTTAEHMVSTIAGLIEHELQVQHPYVQLTQVILQETPRTQAVWRS